MGKKKEAKQAAKLAAQRDLETRKEPLIKKLGEAPVDGRGFYESDQGATEATAPAKTTEQGK